MRRPAPTISRKADEDGGGAEQAELLADGGEDEVGLDRRDAVGVAEAEPVPATPPHGQGEPGLDDLVARAGGRAHGLSQSSTRFWTWANGSQAT